MAKQILFGTLDDKGALPKGAGVVADADAFIRKRPWISRAIVHVSRIDELTNTAFGKAHPDGASAVMEVWTQEDRLVEPDEAPFHCIAAYQVNEIVEKGDARRDVGKLPGVTMVSRVYHKYGISRDAFREKYDRHPLVALRVHVGMESYTRHHIDAASPQDAEPFWGISCLHFASDEDYIDRLYTDDEARAAIAADVAGFMDREKSISMLARSFVLK